MPAINKIHITGFKAFPNDFELELEGKHLLLYGENGSGKSSIYYALHCLFQSPFKQDDGKKYFDENNEQHLKNLNNLTADSKIWIDFEGRHPFIYLLDKDGYNTKSIGDKLLLPAGINGCFINHQFIFHFFNFRNSQKINLFPVFIKDILPFCKDESSGYYIGQIYDDITFSIMKKGRHVDPQYIVNIECFNNAVKQIVENINIYASDIYNNYFKDAPDYSLQIRLRYDSNSDKPYDDPNEYWLKYDNIIERVNENNTIIERRSSYKKLNTPFIGLEISEIIDDGSRKVLKPQSYFNEAKLTAIALSIRFALLNLDKPADGRFLALDDMLISLDMSNRSKVMDFLLNISDRYKIYLFTHDRAFFELFKDVIKAKFPDFNNMWLFKEIYNDDDVSENPKYFNSDDAFTRALFHFKKFDYPASANYLRKSVEEMISLFPPYISRNEDGLEKEKLRNKIEAAKALLKNADGYIDDIQDVILSLNTLLNPLSHRSIDTNVYRIDLIRVINILPRLKQRIIDLKFKEVIAIENDVFFCIDENDHVKCEIKIKLKLPLYSYTGADGNRKFSVANGDSIESVTIKDGVKEEPKPFTYYKKLSLEEICKNLHEYLHKTYTGNYQDFYKDKDGNSINTLL